MSDTYSITVTKSGILYCTLDADTEQEAIAAFTEIVTEGFKVELEEAAIEEGYQEIGEDTVYFTLNCINVNDMIAYI